MKKHDPISDEIIEVLRSQNDKMALKITSMESKMSTMLKLVNDIHGKVNSSSKSPNSPPESSSSATLELSSAD